MGHVDFALDNSFDYFSRSPQCTKSQVGLQSSACYRAAGCTQGSGLGFAPRESGRKRTKGSDSRTKGDGIPKALVSACLVTCLHLDTWRLICSHTTCYGIGCESRPTPVEHGQHTREQLLLQKPGRTISCERVAIYLVVYLLSGSRV